jgi:hypothetical protein
VSIGEVAFRVQLLKIRYFRIHRDQKYCPAKLVLAGSGANSPSV